MNQVQSGYYESYQPSYQPPTYQAPSTGQWGGQGYNSQVTDQSYYSSNQSDAYYSYNTPKSYSTPCMGRCNPPKLYADTYNYLTENLMKPVIQEVYHDLKNITSANVVANHSLASKIGLNDQGQGQSPPEAQSLPEHTQGFAEKTQS